MKSINLNNLEKYKEGNNKGNIDWIHSIGKYLDFTYENFSGQLLIKEYNPLNQHVLIEYKNNILDIFVSNLKKCGIGGLFNVRKYKYDIGNIVDVRNNKFEILTQTHSYHGKNKKSSCFSYLCKCLTCGYEKIIREQSLIKLCGCTKCGDGVSYPEKFVINVLDQLDVDIEVQKTFKWSNKKRYDIYIPSTNTIIEINGLQHYDKSLDVINEREEQENDKLKQKLASDNNINKYIIIDAKRSTSDYMKKSILNSVLSKIYNLDNIDWNECDKNSYKSYVRLICDEWNQKEHLSIDALAVKFHRCQNTIQKYLRMGNNLGWCTYDKKENMKNGRNKAGITHQFNKPVICITTGKKFESQTAATEYYNIYRTGVSDCCRGHISSAGKDPVTGESLIWKYVS